MIILRNNNHDYWNKFVAVIKENIQMLNLITIENKVEKHGTETNINVCNLFKRLTC